MRSGGSSSSTSSTDALAAGAGKAPGRATLVFDADCTACSRFAAVVRAADRRGRITFVSMHDGAVEARLRPQLGDAYDLSFHLVLEPGGRVVSGEAALEDLVRLFPALRPFGAAVFRTPGVRRLPAALYRSLSAGRRCRQRPA